MNNRQKTSFRYFTWNIEEVSVGRLICISFVSGLLMSFLLNKTINNDTRTNQKNDADKKTNENNYPLSDEDKNEYNEIPPERDLRDTQPTISVNYRVIKDNGGNDLKDSNQTSMKPNYQNDWINNDSEW
tara:strand:+ start:2004 stop:2390 length:387 start_codon:yes stop_codon:yes gene_type:complete